MPANRRELATRTKEWPRAIARSLARMGVTPNTVSVASIGFSALAAYAFLNISRGGHEVATLLLAAAAIQLRLLCNLLDGLLAIEGGLKSKTGDLYNEIPDRIDDLLILGASGFALPPQTPFGVGLGLTAAILALLTAYVRLLGGSLGLQQDFVGPFAKQHRMFVLTVGTLGAAIEFAWIGKLGVLHLTLMVLVAGTAFTLVRRILRIARQLNAR